MPIFPDAVLVNVNPSFGRFAQPLVNLIAQKTAIAEWQYCQSPDEPSCLDVALVLLQDFLKQSDRPVHLIGHGTGGLVALLYSSFHPERVKSLTLLSVGAYPAIDWQAHYYVQLKLLPYSRETLLTQMVYSLFGELCPRMTRRYRQVLDDDLALSLSVHNLYQQQLYLVPEQVSVPLLVCRGEEDGIIDRNLGQGWQTWFKPGDRFWECPGGKYFFHYFSPCTVQEQIDDFWQSLSLLASPLKVGNVR